MHTASQIVTTTTKTATPSHGHVTSPQPGAPIACETPSVGADCSCSTSLCCCFNTASVTWTELRCSRSCSLFLCTSTWIHCCFAASSSSDVSRTHVVHFASTRSDLRPSKCRGGASTFIFAAACTANSMFHSQWSQWRGDLVFHLFFELAKRQH